LDETPERSVKSSRTTAEVEVTETWSPSRSDDDGNPIAEAMDDAAGLSHTRGLDPVGDDHVPRLG
jgi:hypothetical protein